MIAGDSETVTVAIADVDGDPFLLTTGDKIYFTVKRLSSDAENAVQIIVDSFTDGVATVEIEPDDTEELNGGYVYDIQLTDKNGKVITIIEPSAFIVVRGVTE